MRTRTRLHPSGSIWEGGGGKQRGANEMRCFGEGCSASVANTAPRHEKHVRFAAVGVKLTAKFQLRNRSTRLKKKKPLSKDSAILADDSEK